MSPLQALSILVHNDLHGGIADPYSGKTFGAYIAHVYPLISAEQPDSSRRSNDL